MSGDRKRRIVSLNDPVLERLILAEDEEARRTMLGSIVTTHARPVIEKALSRYRRGDRLLRNDEADDLTSAVILRLVRRLHAVPEEEAAAIERLGDFTATLTFNVLYDLMRKRFPERTRLRNRVRSLLARDARFGTWLANTGELCALAEWNFSAPPAGIGSFVLPAGLDRNREADAIEALLRAARAPLAVDDVVRCLAETWKVADDASESGEAWVAPSQQTDLENRQYLERLWREIGELRAPQRAALLFNLRETDSGNALGLFVIVGVASLDQIAEAMGITVQQLGEIWSELPLDDSKIGSMLGITRQQVINLRKSARERLARRMKNRFERQ